eukprot:m.100514 g.100514  ORF g.100514 m.100514 type:complete len:73 (-) comp12491_c0_seq2:3950-4168(-)
MSSSCAEIRERVKECISRSECMVVQKKSAKECLNPQAELVSAECKSLITLLYHCKRGQLDQRSRFRGNKFNN